MCMARVLGMYRAEGSLVNQGLVGQRNVGMCVEKDFFGVSSE